VDVTVGGRVFRCHKAILGARSPVLKAAFVHNMVEKATGKINIDGIESNTVEDMLKYIYGGKIENLEDKATKLLAAADQYDLKLLKKKCESSSANLSTSPTVSTISSWLTCTPRTFSSLWSLGLWLKTAERWSPRKTGRRS